MFWPDPTNPPPVEIGVHVPLPSPGDPKHTSVFTSLIGVGRTDFREILRKVFNIANPRVLEDLEHLARMLDRDPDSRRA